MAVFLDLFKYDDLIEIFHKKECKILKNEPLSKYTTFKIGGPADLLIEVGDVHRLTELVKYIKENTIPFFVIGNGSNLLVSDEGFRGVIIKLCGDFNSVRLMPDNQMRCRCGASLAKACVFALQNSLSGLEFAWGIPGSCGGAVYMNAGAYNKELESLLQTSTYISSDGEIKTISKENMALSYRKSIYTNKDYIIIDMILKLTPDDPDEIRNRMYEIIKKRKSKQPLEYPNCGSVFKRPGNGYYAGALIEKSGLKGKSFGGAMVSTKHAGFIINTGNATCEDVAKLIRHIKKTVFQESGIMLECEVKTLGKVNLDV